MAINSTAAQPPTLLHVTASPRTASISTAVSGEVVAAWLAAHPGGRVIRRDLGAHPVPHITDAWTEICDNLMRDRITALDRLHEGVRTEAQREAWAVVEPLLAELVEAEVVVLATPMYNYSISSSLKAWLDQVTFPRMDLSPREFVVVAARGGWYGEGSPHAGVEHQTRYLSDFVQGHYGVRAPVTVTVDLANSRVDPLLADARDAHHLSYEAALEQARAAGRALGEWSVVS